MDTTFSKNPDTPPAQPFPTDGRKLFSLWTCTISAPPPATAAPAASTTAQNYRQRRSALRSAKCHATRRAQLCTRSMLSLLFIVRLRRIVNGTLGFPGGPGDVGASSGSAKRRPAERPSSGCSSSSSGSCIRSSASGMRVVTPEEFFACAALPQGRRERWLACKFPAPSESPSLAGHAGRCVMLWLPLHAVCLRP